MYASQKVYSYINNGQKGSSYPYISGDFFKFISDYSIECTDDLLYLKKLSPEIRLIFISVSFLEKHSKELISLLEKLNIFKKNIRFDCVIHNGDSNVNPQDLCKLKKYFNLYMVNVVDIDSGINPLPIGLENINVGRSGSLNLFHNWEKKINTGRLIKKQMVYTSFNIYTNSDVRQPLKDLLCKSRFIFDNKKIDFASYLDKIATSYFTFSPQGNGYDCHRTWESIYLKCIPIVLRNTLHPVLTDNLPILVIDTWDSFFKLDDNELLEIYDDLSKRNISMAYADYWIKLLKKL